jgi:hypothetical protein
MNLKRFPFYGGVMYVDPVHPNVAITGHYSTHLFEGDCTEWELQIGSDSMWFPSRDQAEMIMYRYLKGCERADMGLCPVPAA